MPGTALASDQPYRDLDLAIDFCEDVDRLPPEAISRIVDLFHQAGATCKVSSIHVNGWFGRFDKLAGFRQFHQDRYGSTLDVSRWAFFGDSANDEPMFSAVPLSVGVANVARFLPRMTGHPTWITEAEGGHELSSSERALDAVTGTTSTGTRARSGNSASASSTAAFSARYVVRRSPR